MREATARRNWVAGELAAMRVPNLQALTEASHADTVRSVCDRWRASRVDVADGTAATYDVNLGRILPRVGDHSAAELRPEHVADLVGELAEQGPSPGIDPEDPYDARASAGLRRHRAEPGSRSNRQAAEGEPC